MSESPTSGTVTIGGNEEVRTATVIGHYLERRAGAEAAGRFKFHWRERWPDQPPDWLVTMAPGPLPDHIDPPVMRREGQSIALARYETAAVYPHGLINGWHCALFRRVP